MELINRCNRFFDELEVPVTVFARKVNLSTQSVYKWRKQSLQLSENSLRRIDEYLTQYGF